MIRPPATYADWYKRPVLGLACLASHLKMHGFDVAILDAYYHAWSEGELTGRVSGFRPDVIGLTAMTHEIIHAARIASRLRESLKVPTVIGGCHVTALPGETLAEFPAFDYAVFGEGEKSTVELVQNLRQGALSGLHAIRGLAFRDGSRVVVNEPRAYLTSAELTALPFPAFDEYYGRQRVTLSRRKLSYPIASSRGCPYRCAFCMQVLGRQIRRRSAESICREIEYAMERYGADRFDFLDEIFLYDCHETRGILEAMIARGLSERMQWTGQTRANFVTMELIALARNAGCVGLGMGVESGDDGILREINKGITVQQVRRAVSIVKESGISLGTYYILGHPHENRETLRKTVRLAAELNTDTVAIGVMVPYPGTRIYEMAHRGAGGYRLIARDWSDYDKYGAHALELDGLPHRELRKWQRRAILRFYLGNLRIGDLVRYLWSRRRAFSFLLRRSVVRAASRLRGIR